MVPESTKTPDTVRFGGDYEFNPRIGELRRAGRLLKLERIPTELLSLLVERQGQLVTRDEIIARVWGKDVFLDTDSGINAAVRKIRQVLRDDPAQPRFVQTVTGRGYRFIAAVSGDGMSPVRVAEELASPAPNPAGLPEEDIPPSRPLVPRGWLLRLAILLVVVAFVAVYFHWFWDRARERPAPEGRVVLAVLPFENLTGDAGQEYFSDGMTEEMIAQLGRLDPEHLGVIARTSVMLYKQNPRPLDQIGRELGVQYVLEGSVRRDADKVRITAQLIRMKDQTHLWSRQYDRELSRLLVLEGEIAGEIADEIQLTLGDNRQRKDLVAKPSLSREQYAAYDSYLKGLYFWNKRTAQDFLQAIEYFQQSIAQDSSYAPAYAGLADSYALLGGYTQGFNSDLMPKARAAALRALELDQGLAEAHTALALIVQNYDWDWVTAETEFQRAIQLNPNYATAHHWYAEHLALLGRFDEAFRESERARQLDPLSLIIATDNGAILYFSHQYDRAIAQFRAVLDMDPSYPRASIVVHAYEQKGMFAEAMAEVEKRKRTGGAAYNAWAWEEKAYIYGRSGEPVEARHAIDSLQQIYRRYPADAYGMVWAWSAVDKEQTLAWLEKAYAQHSNAVTTLKVEPAFDWLRGDPRFQDLMRRVRLAP